MRQGEKGRGHTAWETGSWREKERDRVGDRERERDRQTDRQTDR